jgi:hypothetical protein
MVFWKWTELLKFDSGQNGVTWVISQVSLDHLRKRNPVNTENQSPRYFLKFPTHPYRLTRVSRTKIIATWKQGQSAEFSKILETDLGWGARVRFGLRTELKLQLGQKWSIAHDPFQIGDGFQIGNFFSSVLHFWIESVRSEQSSQN